MVQPTRRDEERFATPHARRQHPRARRCLRLAEVPAGLARQRMRPRVYVEQRGVRRGRQQDVLLPTKHDEEIVEAVVVCRGVRAPGAQPERGRGGRRAPGRQLPGPGRQAPGGVRGEVRHLAAETYGTESGIRPLSERLEEVAPPRPHLAVALPQEARAPHRGGQEARVVPVGELAAGRRVKGHSGGRAPLELGEVAPAPKLRPRLRLRQAEDHWAPEARRQGRAAQLAQVQGLDHAGSIQGAKIASTSTQGP
mmetsp:Transcript_63476/g.185595  ORF Transcript_63476/g.185595 Transcript_63476/m.185595 type:complete len:253 (-) Transcript_63476:101-859(-)